MLPHLHLNGNDDVDGTDVQGQGVTVHDLPRAASQTVVETLQHAISFTREVVNGFAAQPSSLT